MGLTLLLLCGCQSDEERCNEARVAAHDGLAGYATELDAEAAAADEAFNAANVPAQAEFLRARRAAWEACRSEVTQRFRTQHGFLYTVNSAIDYSLGRNPRFDDQEVDTLRGVPQPIKARLREALQRARAVREQAIGEVRATRDAARQRARLAHDAAKAASGGAIAARDTARAALEEGEGAAAEAARASTEVAWEACREVDP